MKHKLFIGVLSVLLVAGLASSLVDPAKDEDIDVGYIDGFGAESADSLGIDIGEGTEAESEGMKHSSIAENLFAAYDYEMERIGLLALTGSEMDAYGGGNVFLHQVDPGAAKKVTWGFVGNCGEEKKSAEVGKTGEPMGADSLSLEGLGADQSALEKNGEAVELSELTLSGKSRCQNYNFGEYEGLDSYSVLMRDQGMNPTKFDGELLYGALPDHEDAPEGLNVGEEYFFACREGASFDEGTPMFAVADGSYFVCDAGRGEWKELEKTRLVSFNPPWGAEAVDREGSTDAYDLKTVEAEVNQPASLEGTGKYELDATFDFGLPRESLTLKVAQDNEIVAQASTNRLDTVVSMNDREVSLEEGEPVAIKVEALDSTEVRSLWFFEGLGMNPGQNGDFDRHFPGSTPSDERQEGEEASGDPEESREESDGSGSDGEEEQSSDSTGDQTGEPREAGEFTVESAPDSFDTIEWDGEVLDFSEAENDFQIDGSTAYWTEKVYEITWTVKQDGETVFRKEDVGGFDRTAFGSEARIPVKNLDGNRFEFTIRYADEYGGEPDQVVKGTYTAPIGENSGPNQESDRETGNQASDQENDQASESPETGTPGDTEEDYTDRGAGGSGGMFSGLTDWATGF